MYYLDTPAGKFQILCNGIPTGFDAEMRSPYSYYGDGSLQIPIAASYEINLPCQGLTVGDILDVCCEKGTFAYDGGGEYRLNAIGSMNGYTIRIGVPDTQELLDLYGIQWIPYRNLGLSTSGFAFKVLADPKGILTICIKALFVLLLRGSQMRKPMLGILFR